jgi:hypothetical protein
VLLVGRQVAGRRNVAQMFGHVGRRTQNWSADRSRSSTRWARKTDSGSATCIGSTI